MTKNKKTIIKVFGDMYEANVIEITEEDIERLIQARDGDNDFWDDIEDIKEEILSDSLINGFTIVNGANFTVEIDGTENKGIIEKFDDSLKNYAPYCMDWDSGNYLVYEQWATGSSSYEVNDVFEESNLNLDLEDQILPNGIMRTIMRPTYGDDEFEFLGNKVSKISLYVIKADGEKISL